MIMTDWNTSHSHSIHQIKQGSAYIEELYNKEPNSRNLYLYIHSK